MRHMHVIIHTEITPWVCLVLQMINVWPYGPAVGKYMYFWPSGRMSYEESRMITYVRIKVHQVESAVIELVGRRCGEIARRWK